MKRRVFFSIFLLLSTVTTPLCAKATDNSPFSFNYAIDTSIVVLAGSLFVMPIFIQSDLPYNPKTVGDISDINRLDRHLAERTGISEMATVSDIALVAIPALGYGLTFLHNGGKSGSELLEDMVLIAQAAAINGALYQVVAHSVGRPRPYMYSEEKLLSKGNNQDFVSFYSGHTSSTAALAGSIAAIHSIRYPNSPYRVAVWTTAVVGSVGVGAARILAGKHFYTDVIMGLTAGFSIGTLVPYLHKKSNKQISLISTGDGIGLAYNF